VGKQIESQIGSEADAGERAASKANSVIDRGGDMLAPSAYFLIT